MIARSRVLPFHTSYHHLWPILCWIACLYGLAAAGCYDTVPPDPQGAQELLSPLLRDPDPLVRRTAAESLGKIGDPTAAPLLTEALHDSDAAVREAAARALGRLPSVNSSIGEALIGFLRDPDEDVRRAAAQALAAAEWQPSMLDRLAVLLQDPEAAVRRAAGHALLSAEGRTSRVTAALAEAAEDPDPMVRQWAIAALAEISGEEAAPALVERLARDRAEGVRTEAAYRLGFVGDRSVVAKLDGAALRDASAGLRRWLQQSRAALTKGSGSD